MSNYVSPPDGLATQNDGTEDVAINNTLFNRLLTLLALKTTAKFYSRCGSCIRISRKKIVKTGPWVHLTEAATMKFVSDNTSIPVPKVYCSFVRKNRAYIVMERIKGEDIPDVWDKMTEDSRQKLLSELQDMVRDLRSLKPSKGHGVSNCFGGSLRDSRIPKSRPRFGPFGSVNEFHLWLRDYLQPEEHSTWGDEQEWEEIKRMAAKQDETYPPPVFTHGDLNPSNVLVRNGKVAGIIDWEFSGWYPHYWEYTTTWLGNATRTEWRDRLCEVLDQFPAEFEMEKVRHRWWGDF